MPESLETVRRRLGAGEPCRVLGLGDSLTYGWEVQRGFFDRFCDALAERFPDSNLERINAGIPGDTASGGLARLHELITTEPHLATVQFAINDCFGMVDVGSFTDSIRTIARRLSESGSAVVLCTSCSVLHLDEAKDLEPFYEAIAKVAKQLHLPLAALDEYWDRTVGVDEGLFGWDGIHPTDQGHEIMAKGLLDVVLGEKV